jgi:acyl-CoA reductase-like NAD-dependent aldehyde dehydrogenase
MQPYAILSADLQSVIEVKQIDPATVEKFRADGNAKALRIRDAVEGTKPTPSSTQVVIPTGWDIGETIATRTYGLRDKTPEEIETETKAAARDALISNAIADFNLALTNWDTLTTAQRTAVLRRCVQVLIAMLRNELIQ